MKSAAGPFLFMRIFLPPHLSSFSIASEQQMPAGKEESSVREQACIAQSNTTTAFFALPACSSAVLPSLQTRLSSLLTTFYAYNIDGCEKEKGIEWAREREMKEREREKQSALQGRTLFLLARNLTHLDKSQRKDC